MITQEQRTVSRANVSASRRAARRRASWGSIGRSLGVALIVIIAIAPLYWTFITSVKSEVELNVSPPTVIPQSFSMDNYMTDLTHTPTFIHGLINSTVVALITTFLALVFGSLCAYAIARMKFNGKSLVLGIILSVHMFPYIAMVGPLFVLFTGPAYLYNSYLALIIPDLVGVIPLTVWFLVSFFRDLPPDLEEAARIDGASWFVVLKDIIMPLTAPGVFAVAILSFIGVWNDFIFGLTLTADSNAQPVTVAIANFTGEHTIPWGEIAAASVIVTLPLVIMVLVLQRRIVSGLTAGAVKG